MTIEEALNRYGDRADYLEVIKSHKGEAMPLFEVAIVESDAEGKNEKLVYGPKALVQASAEAAKTQAVIEASGEVDGIKPDANLKVLCRSFQ